MNHDEYLKLVTELNHHAYLYYCCDTSEISDSDYDILYRKLVDFENDNPTLVSVESPTQRVGDKLSSHLGKVKRRFKMYSLDNIFTFEELRDWLQNSITKYPIAVRVEPKYDGLAVEATFDKDGGLITASTRGDGFEGEDITLNYKAVYGAVIVSPKPGVVAVRGEVVLPKSSLTMINTTLAKNGDKPYSNTRNAAAGTIRQLDSAIVRSRRLMFIPYDFLNESGELLLNEGTYLVMRDKDDLLGIWDAVRKIMGMRSTLNYDIDGAVIKIDCIEHQRSLGYTSRAPRFAMAFKFAEKQVTTTLLEIVPQVGRTGIITPRADLEPVEVVGVMVSSATVHNYDEVARLSLKRGCKVSLKRAGEVIPAIVAVVDDNGGELISPPTHCPCCSTELVSDDKKVGLYCPAGWECQDQAILRIVHFASKKCMDMTHVDLATVTEWYLSGLVRRPHDLFNIAQMQLPLSGRMFVKQRKAIMDAKSVSLSRLIGSLGIPGVMESTAKVLAEHYGSFENFLQLADYAGLIKLSNIGEVTAKDIINSINTEVWFWNLLRLGINPTVVKTVKVTGPLTGEVVVITGSFKYVRSEIELRLKLSGAEVRDIVNKKVTLLLAGDSAGSKLDKAKELGIKVLGAEYVNELMKELK